ncbi:S26 family signal peptidase [Propionibacteriaceae bacterium Y1923]
MPLSQRPTRAGTAAEAAPAGARGRSRARTVVEVTAVVVATLLAVGLLGSVAGRPGRADATMEPLIRAGQRVWLVQPTTPERGDIVVIIPDLRWHAVVADDPGSVTKALRWLRIARPPEGSRMLVRIIGVPGDEVRCCDGNGSPLVNGHPVPAAMPGNHFRVVVPEGRWFVASDSPSSASSACYLSSLGIEAMVTTDRIEARVARVGWPWAATDLSADQRIYTGIPGNPAPVDPIIEAGKDPTC